MNRDEGCCRGGRIQQGYEPRGELTNTFFPSNGLSDPWERPRCLSPISGVSPTTDAVWRVGRVIATAMQRIADPVYGRAKCLPMLGSLKT